MKPNGKIKCDILRDFQVFYLNRQKSQGGGVALGVHKEIESTLIRDGDDETEVISVQTILGGLPVRLIVGYGPQENATLEKKIKFWNFVENEVKEAELKDNGIIFQMDGNLHAGKNLIKGDPNIENRNGKLFNDFLARNKNLVVLNSLDTCKGVITRKRKLENKIELSVLDFCLINEKLRPYFKEMQIDEERLFCLANIAQIKKNKRIIESDHNSLIIEFDIKIEPKAQKREEIFNFRNKHCQNLFKEATDNNMDFKKCFENNLPFEKQTKIWFNVLKAAIFKSFKKIRIVKNKKKEDNKKRMFEKLIERKNLMNNLDRENVSDEDMKRSIENRIKQIEHDIEEEVSDNQIEKIVETLRELGGEEDAIRGEGRNKMWKLLKEIYPKVSPAVPVGKKDKRGNIITNHKSLKHLYLRTYINRLRNRPIKDGFEELKRLKINLFSMRLQLPQNRKSEPWTMRELEKVLKCLKRNKARDPNGLVNELFKDGVVGKDLKLSLLTLLNKIKENNFIPDFIQLADVATIYKGKGDKSDLKNDRGIFLVTIFRSILMRLIYLDYYDELDKSISDSQVGGRRGKSVRNHIWILNGVICDVLSKRKKHPVDLQIYDYRQCFDSLWLEECMNDIFSGGVQDDKFAILYNINTKVNVAIKTPIGKTDRKFISNSIIQGDVFGPMFCSKQIDEIGKECLELEKYTYLYKGEVAIPPLIMLDDLAVISECGPKSSMANSYVRFKTNSKKLQFGAEKCKKLHIGKSWDEYKCLPLYVESWEEKEVESSDKCENCGKGNMGKKAVKSPQGTHVRQGSFDCQNCDNKFMREENMKHPQREHLKCEQCGKTFATEVMMKEHEMLHMNDSVEIKILDVCNGEEQMEIKEDEKYLGDIISNNGRNIKNIRARVGKGIGIMKNIFNLIDGIPFGKFYFEVAIILRNSLFVSSVLFNSEVWYNLTNAELDLLETVDVDLLRGILKAPKSTPKEMLFLELGILPLREIIRKRRLGFLFYILKQKRESILYKVFETQKMYPSSKDWVSTIKDDLEQINMKTSFEEIQNMEKKDYMNTIKRKINQKTLQDLNKIKENHSKVQHLVHKVLKMQKYFMPSEKYLKIEDSQLIFKLRCRTTDVKMNMKGFYETFKCRACGDENETQNHVLNCKILLEMNKDSEKQQYEKLFSNNLNDQIKICKQFRENMKIMEEMKT